MNSSQVKAQHLQQQQNNMAGPGGTGWPRRNSQNSSTAAVVKAEPKFTATPAAINRIINL